MRFTTAWADVVTQNLSLKIFSGILGISLITSLIITGHLALKEPIVIERGCFSRPITPADNKRTEKEMEAFVKEALPLRFNSNANGSHELLSIEEMTFREQEQQQLKSKNISQSVIVNDVKTEGSVVKVDAVRVFYSNNTPTSVGFPLIVALTTTDRTASNPYGLIISRVSSPERKGQ